MIRTINHLLGRTRTIRRQLELEQRTSGARRSRLLRLQALLLRAQHRLADLVVPAGPRLVPAVAALRRSRTFTSH